MAGSLKAKELIREALGRALFDAPPLIFEGFAWNCYLGKTKPCEPHQLLAQRVVRELTLAGYELLGARDWTSKNWVTARMLLEDHIACGIDMTSREFREALDNPSRAIADDARDKMTESICQTLNTMKVTLGLRRR